jgi:hypothetical protein
MLVPRIGNNPSAEELVPKLIADKVKLTPTKLKFHNKERNCICRRVELNKD